MEKTNNSGCFTNWDASGCIAEDPLDDGKCTKCGKIEKYGKLYVCGPCSCEFYCKNCFNVKANMCKICEKSNK